METKERNKKNHTSIYVIHAVGLKIENKEKKYFIEKKERQNVAFYL